MSELKKKPEPSEEKPLKSVVPDPEEHVEFGFVPDPPPLPPPTTPPQKSDSNTNDSNYSANE